MRPIGIASARGMRFSNARAPQCATVHRNISWPEQTRAYGVRVCVCARGKGVEKGRASAPAQATVRSEIRLGLSCEKIFLSAAMEKQNKNTTTNVVSWSARLKHRAMPSSEMGVLEGSGREKKNAVRVFGTAYQGWW